MSALPPDTIYAVAASWRFDTHAYASMPRFCRHACRHDAAAALPAALSRL